MTLTDDDRKPYPRGTYSKVARQLGITPQTVRDVAIGAKRSARVERALRRVLRRVDRKASKQQRVA